VSLTSSQKSAFFASFLGWTLDAFDFFLLVFVIPHVASDLHHPIPDIALTITLTLAMRPIGAIFFGYLADRFGRKPSLMLDILFYSMMEFLTGFSRSYEAFLMLRLLYGIGMGGEWGVGAALAMESVPKESRGILSGILQEGYLVGYLLAALAYNFVFPSFGWRVLFWLGILPAFLVFFILIRVEESPVWAKNKTVEKQRFVNIFSKNLSTFIYAVFLMTAFNFMSHGTQDLYPTFLEKQKLFSVHWVALMAVLASIGGIIGGIFYGFFSQKIGRRNAILASVLTGIFFIPLWVFSNSKTQLAVGVFGIQFFVQGAWGVVPAYLNELSPKEIRGTFPGFVYQLGNLLSSVNAYLQAWLAVKLNNNYAIPLAVVAGITMLAVAILTWFGAETKDAPL
jgi:SHS family lactate transporter-like MFS transporter